MSNHPADTWLDDGDVRLYHGDALEQLALMPSESVQMIVTSPPFFALRDYGVDGQIGLEESPEAWCDALVAVFREARRVLRSDGVMWLEVGDTYANLNHAPGSTQDGSRVGGSRALQTGIKLNTGTIPANCKPKDLVGAPWLLAFALRADGWYLRSDTIWARPNPMPESVTDRPTKAHSYVFLLTKSARYFFDADAIREAHQQPERSGKEKFRWSGRYTGGGNAMAGGLDNHANAGDTGSKGEYNPAGRNARSVWSIATEPTPFAHFATFPQALVERCIKAGTSEHGACSECGAPWRRIVNQPKRPDLAMAEGGTPQTLPRGGGNGEWKKWREANPPTTTGWEPSCDCASCFACDGQGDVQVKGAARLTCGQCDGTGLDHPPVVPCVVLDCFSGSATTALVARRLGRHAIGIELNEEYLRISAQRLQQPTLWSEPV